MNPKLALENATISTLLIAAWWKPLRCCCGRFFSIAVTDQRNDGSIKITSPRLLPAHLRDALRRQVV